MIRRKLSQPQEPERMFKMAAFFLSQPRRAKTRLSTGRPQARSSFAAPSARQETPAGLSAVAYAKAGGLFQHPPNRPLEMQ